MSPVGEAMSRAGAAVLVTALLVALLALWLLAVPVTVSALGTSVPCGTPIVALLMLLLDDATGQQVQGGSELCSAQLASNLLGGIVLGAASLGFAVVGLALILSERRR